MNMQYGNGLDGTRHAYTMAFINLIQQDIKHIQQMRAPIKKKTISISIYY